jgi:DNA-binding CsgD family transcriptional regulator
MISSRAMDPTKILRAIEALMSPLEWGSQEVWLADCLTRVRDARGLQGSSGPLAVTDQLEELLHLEGDEPGWLQAALAVAADIPGVGGLRQGVAASEDSLPLMSMRCALAAGITTVQRLHDWQSTLGQVCEDVSAGMAILRSAGLGTVARNALWNELLDDEPERDRLLEVITRQAGHTASSAGSLREDYGELELSGRTYRLITRRAPAGTLLPDAAVLVLLDRLGPELPTTREIRVTFGLRGREPQVALLAAEGLSNDAIAQRLQLSTHTVRHYLERVMSRLGLHSRKALALHLMGAEPGEAPTDASGATSKKKMSP